MHWDTNINFLVQVVHSASGIDVESIVFHEILYRQKNNDRYGTYLYKYDYASSTKCLIESVRARAYNDAHTMCRGNHSKCTAKVVANVVVEAVETVIVERHCNHIRLVHLSSKNRLPFTTCTVDHPVVFSGKQTFRTCSPDPRLPLDWIFSIKTPGVNF